MLKEEIHIRVEKELLSEIDRVAKYLGLNRSQLIRLAVRSFLAHRKKMLLDLVVLESYEET